MTEPTDFDLLDEILSSHHPIDTDLPEDEGTFCCKCDQMWPCDTETVAEWADALVEDVDILVRRLEYSNSLMLDISYAIGRFGTDRLRAVIEALLEDDEDE